MRLMKLVEHPIDYSAIAKVVKSCLKSNQGRHELHRPFFSGNEWTYLKECLDTRWVSSAGTFVDRFEKMLADYTAVKKAVAVVNGTSALHAALLLVDVQRNDEVLVPALTNPTHHHLN